MKERPILFSAPMVRALLAGTKTQTRRVVKPQPVYDGRFAGGWKLIGKGGHEAATCSPLIAELCPYGQPGNLLWVRENFWPIFPQDPHYNGGRPIEYDYRATYKHGDRLGDLIGVKKKWKPSIHMPRTASRITLEVTGVRVERLQDISADDARAEGCPDKPMPGAEQASVDLLAKLWFHDLWAQINGQASWDANPWVWVVEFKQIDGT